MTQLSFDAGKRVPLLDLASVGKSARPGGNQDELFDSHLNRASAPPSSPATSTAASASSSARPAEYSYSEPTPSKSSLEEGAPPQQASADTSDHEDNAAATASNAPETQETPAKQAESDKEEDHDGEDEVDLSEESAAVAQQSIVVEYDAEMLVDNESVESVEKTDQSPEEEARQEHDAAQPKTKKQSDHSQQVNAANKSNKLSAAAANQKSAQQEEQSSEPTLEGVEQLDVEAVAMPEESQEELATEGTDNEKLSARQKTTTITIKDGQTNESSNVVVNQEVKSESLSTDATDDENSEQPAASKSTSDASRLSSLSADSDVATPSGKQSKEQQAALAVGSELPSDANSDSGSSNSQDGTGDDQRSDQSKLEVSVNKAGTVVKSASESTSTSKQLTTSSEAPVQRTEPSASSTSSTSSNDSVSATDRARFVQRVYRALHTAHERGGEVRLRLSPPELGNLTLELKLHDGAMIAHIEAETSAARTLLLDNLSALKDRLAAHDIQVEKFEVELKNQSQQQSPDGHSQNAEDGKNLRNVLRKPYMSTAKVEEQGDSPAVRPENTSGQLNVII